MYKSHFLNYSFICGHFKCCTHECVFRCCWRPLLPTWSPVLPLFVEQQPARLSACVSTHAEHTTSTPGSSTCCSVGRPHTGQTDSGKTACFKCLHSVACFLPLSQVWWCRWMRSIPVTWFWVYYWRCATWCLLFSSRLLTAVWRAALGSFVKRQTSLLHLSNSYRYQSW